MVVPVAEIFHVQLRERFLRPLFGCGAAQAVVHGAEDHIVEHGGHEHLVVGVLQHIAELPAHLREGLPRDRDAVHGDAARIGKQTERGLHERGFTRAVGADEPDLLAAADLKRQLPQNRRIAVEYTDMIKNQHHLRLFSDK